MWRCVARHGSVRCGTEWFVPVRQVGLGWASFGAKWCGEAGYGKAGMARLGTVRLGLVRQVRTGLVGCVQFRWG